MHLINFEPGYFCKKAGVAQAEISSGVIFYILKNCFKYL